MSDKRTIYQAFARGQLEGLRAAWANQETLKHAMLNLEAPPQESLLLPYFTARIAHAYEQGDTRGLLAWSEKATATSPPPIPLLLLHYHALLYTNSIARLVDFLFEHGKQAIDNQAWDLGCEALGASFLFDYHHQMKLLEDIPRTQEATQYYERVARHLEPSLPPRQENTPPATKGKQRIGLLVPNLVDDLVAFSKRILDFVQQADPDRYDLFVFSSENACLRNRILPVPLLSHPSGQRAPKLIALLHKRKVPLFIAPTEKPFCETALELASAISRCHLDALYVQSGCAMPIDWLATRLAQVPTKISIHIGGCTYIPGSAGTVFDNETNLKREEPAWPAHAGRRILIKQGTDIEVLASAPPAQRNEWDLPEEAILVGTLSNWLEDRLSPEYVAVIARLLSRKKQAWFTPIGTDRIPHAVRTVFEQAGVLDRVRFIPRQRHPASLLKMLDIL